MTTKTFIYLLSTFYDPPNWQFASYGPPIWQCTSYDPPKLQFASFDPPKWNLQVMTLLTGNFSDS